MSLLTALGDLAEAWKLWGQYGPTAEKAFAIVEAVDAIDNGHIVDKVEKVLLANGIDLAAMIASLGGAIDLTSIKGIQNALNALGASRGAAADRGSPALAVDGSIGPATIAAIREFQGTHGLTVTGCPDAATVAEIAAALATKP